MRTYPGGDSALDLCMTAPDILLLVLFNLVFFAAAYFSFARYDVR